MPASNAPGDASVTPELVPQLSRAAQYALADMLMRALRAWTRKKPGSTPPNLEVLLGSSQLTMNGLEAHALDHGYCEHSGSYSSADIAAAVEAEGLDAETTAQIMAITNGGVMTQQQKTQPYKPPEEYDLPVPQNYHNVDDTGVPRAATNTPQRSAAQPRRLPLDDIAPQQRIDPPLTDAEIAEAVHRPRAKSRRITLEESPPRT